MQAERSASDLMDQLDFLKMETDGQQMKIESLQSEVQKCKRKESELTVRLEESRVARERLESELRLEREALQSFTDDFEAVREEEGRLRAELEEARGQERCLFFVAQVCTIYRYTFVRYIYGSYEYVSCLKFSTVLQYSAIPKLVKVPYEAA